MSEYKNYVELCLKEVLEDNGKDYNTLTEKELDLFQWTVEQRVAERRMYV
jgi:hypothetical protein